MRGERVRYQQTRHPHTHMDDKKATWLLFQKLFSWISDKESETIQMRLCQQRANAEERMFAVTAKELLKSSEAMQQQQHQRQKGTARDSLCHLTMTSCHVEGSITRVLTVDFPYAFHGFPTLLHCGILNILYGLWGLKSADFCLVYGWGSVDKPIKDLCLHLSERNIGLDFLTNTLHYFFQIILGFL